jgi:hypothetical protein
MGGMATLKIGFIPIEGGHGAHKGLYVAFYEAAGRVKSSRVE